MTNAEVKEYLKQISNLRRSIAAKAMQIQQLREQAESITVALKPDVIQGGGLNNNGFAGTVNKIIDLQFKIAAEQYQQVMAIETIRKQIAAMAVNDATLAEVLEHRYLCGMRWEDVCVKLAYSWPHMHRLHAKALRAFKDYTKHEIE